MKIVKSNRIIATRNHQQLREGHRLWLAKFIIAQFKTSPIHLQNQEKTSTRDTAIQSLAEKEDGD